MPYRDDLEAERARAEALDQRAEELARENAELRAKLDAPDAPAPEAKPAKARREPWRVPSVPRVFLVAAFISFMATIAGTGCVSATMKLAAPVACPKGYVRSVVVLHVRGTSRGGTSYTGDLWCVFPEKHRFPENANTFAVLGVLFGEYLLVTMSLASVIALLARKRRTA